MLRIEIKTIPHSQQRYKTCGDYFHENGKLNVRISDMGEKDYEFLVLIHELIEQYLCERKAIPIEAVDAFDAKFEKNRLPGNTDEPGDDPKAPYYREHQIATAIERMLATQISVDWNTYDRFINSL